MSEFRPGDVPYVPPCRDGLPDSSYVLLSVLDARALLCLAGEDQAGNLCSTGRLFTCHIYHLSIDFRRMNLRVPIAAAIGGLEFPTVIVLYNPLTEELVVPRWHVRANAYPPPYRRVGMCEGLRCTLYGLESP